MDHRGRVSRETATVQSASPIGTMFAMNPSTRRVEVVNHLGESTTYERVVEK